MRMLLKVFDTKVAKTHKCPSSWLNEKIEKEMEKIRKVLLDGKSLEGKEGEG